MKPSVFPPSTVVSREIAKCLEVDPKLGPLTNKEGYMKILVTILSVMAVSSTVLASSPVLDKCASKAIQAATIFQNEIIGEMAVNEASVTAASKTADGLNYSILAVNHNGTRMRDTLVKTDLYCNVQSMSRQ